MSARVQRTQQDLIRKLAQHCDLLEDYHHKGCLEVRSEYLGEIAGKLRLLIYKSRTNRPLLLDLMRQTNTDIPFTIDSPRGEYVTDLFDYVASLACAVRLPSNEMAHLSKSDLVALWAQQAGAAHEDWALDQRLVTIFTGGLRVGNAPFEVRALCGICRTVIYVARKFLEMQLEVQSGA